VLASKLSPVQTRLSARAEAKRVQLLSSTAIQSLSTQRSKQLQPKQTNF